LTLRILAVIGGMVILQARSSPVTIFEGGRLIAGDGRPPIERAAFVVENGRVRQVGAQGSIQAPPGARRVDLTGKTVMPALVDAHVHLGYRSGTTFTAQNYTRANLLDELDRFAYYGVAAVLEAGTGRGVLPFAIRGETESGGLKPAPAGARLLTAGRGFAMPNAGPGVPMRDAPYGVTSEDDAHRDVRELAASRPDMIKIWVDDRGGTVEKLKPNLYRAIIDEAHAHGIRVMAHIAALEDAKDLLRAGVDGFGHVVRDKDIDQELIAMLHERPRVFFTATLWGERNAIYGRKPDWLEEPLVRETLSEAEIASLAAGFSTGPATMSDSGRRLLRNVSALNRAGVALALGTDTGGVTGGGYFGLASLVELELLVKAGMTPAQALAAGTRTSAAVLGLDGLGTIAAGKSASFIVLDANPLDGIANVRRIGAVYLDGVEVNRAALRNRWTAQSVQNAEVRRN
jgi:imidazolonepropionase-like amidohydrolase